MPLIATNLIGARVRYNHPDQQVDGRGVVTAVQPYVNLQVDEDGLVGTYDEVEDQVLVTVQFDSGTMSGTSAGFAVYVDPEGNLDDGVLLPDEDFPG